MARVISLVVLLAIIVVMVVLFYRVMVTFAVPLFLAAVLAVIFDPLHDWLETKLNGRHRVAAAITTLAILLIVLAPIGCVVALAAVEGVSLARSFDQREFRDRAEALRRRMGLEIPFQEDIARFDSLFVSLESKLLAAELGEEDQLAVDRAAGRMLELESEFLQRRNSTDFGRLTPDHLIELRTALEQLQRAGLGTVEFQERLDRAQREYLQFRSALLGGPAQAFLKDAANVTGEEVTQLGNQWLELLQGYLLPVAGMTMALAIKLIIGTAILIVSTYYFFADGPQMIQTVMRLIPLDQRYQHELVKEFARISRGVVIATLLSAIVQGLLAAAGYTAAGVQSVFLLMFLTMILAMIPFMGAAAVWVPVCLWLLFYEDRWLAALLLALYGGLVISLVDNIIKPLVLHGQSRLHPLLALLSVLGGVQALGPIGILIGPMVVAFLQTLLNILHREITHLGRFAQQSDEV